MVVLLTIGAAVLIGASALAIDLSFDTQAQRGLQNTSDAAALGGVRDLPANRTGAIDDALDVLERNVPWSGDASWLASAAAATTCTSNSCVLASYPGPPGYTNYSVSVSSPPQHPHNPAYDTPNYLEVDVDEHTINPLGGLLGLGNTTEVAHSVAWARPPDTPLDFALYTLSQATTGNQAETVVGNVYAAENVNLQGTGHAGFCADYKIPGNPASGGGYIIIGSPQYPASQTGNEQWYQLHNSNPLLGSQTCPQNYANSQAAPLGCPTWISGYIDSGAGTGNTQYCVAQPAIGVPPELPPTLTAPDAPLSLPSCTDPPLTPGMYEITASAAGYLHCPGGLTFTSSATLTCVSFYLPDTAGITVQNKPTITQTPFGPGCPGYVAPALPSPNDGRFAIYSPTGTGGLTLTNNGSTYRPTGTVFMPDGSVVVGQNSVLEITGQAIVGSWNTQSGNHPNPVVTWVAADAAVLAGGLRLVE